MAPARTRRRWVTRITIAFGIVFGGVLGTLLAWAVFSNTPTSEANTFSAAPVNSLSISPSSSSITAGGSQSYTVQALDASNGHLGDVTSLTTFSISPDGSCTGASCMATVSGLHTVTAHFWGLTTTASLTVNPSSATHLVFVQGPTNVVVGQTMSPAVTVQAEDQYNNNANDNGATVTVATSPSVTVSGNSATTNGTGLATFSNIIIDTVGSYTMKASSSGLTSTPASGSFNVTKATTTTSVASSSNPSVTGQTVTFTATIIPQYTGVPTGSVTFTVKDKNSNQVNCSGSNTQTLVAAQASCSPSSLLLASLSPYTVSVSYPGDTNFGSSNGSLSGGQTVNKASTLTQVTSSPTTPVTGQQTVFTATVAATGVGSGTPTGNVTFTITDVNSTTYTCQGGTNTLSLSSGSVGCTIAASQILAANSPYTVHVVYNGDSNYNTSATSPDLSLTVNKDATTTTVSSNPTTPVTGQPTVFTANVVSNSPGSGTPTGSVTFTIKDKNSTTYTCQGGTNTLALSGGSVGCTIAGSQIQAIDSPYTVHVAYNGDSNYSTSSTSPDLSVTVSKDATTTTVLSNPTTPVTGQTTVLTATVTANSPGSGTPTGNVIFTIKDKNSTTYTCQGGTNTLALSGGSVGCTIAGSQIQAIDSPYTVHVAYNGDSNYVASSTSPDLSVMVGKANTSFSITVNGSSSATITFGQQATLAESNLPAGAAGTITFSSSSPSTSLCTVNNYPTSTSCVSSASLAAGSYSGITGTFTDTSGNYNGSTSTNSVSLNVDEAPAITSASQTAFAHGVAGSFTVTTTGFPTPSITNANFAGCSKSSLPTGVTFTDNGNGTATIASTTSSPSGSTTFCLNASNGVGSAATQTFTLNINSVTGIAIENVIVNGSSATPSCSGLGTASETCTVGSGNNNSMTVQVGFVNSSGTLTIYSVTLAETVNYAITGHNTGSGTVTVAANGTTSSSGGTNSAGGVATSMNGSNTQTVTFTFGSFTARITLN